MSGTKEIFSNAERKIKHIKVSDEIMRYFNAWQSLNGFANHDDAFEEMVRKLCMKDVTNLNHLLSNGEIAIRPHQPVKLQV